MTTLTVAAVIAACVIAGVVFVVRRVTGRSTATIDLSNETVSRQWLIEHQSNDAI